MKHQVELYYGLMLGSFLGYATLNTPYFALMFAVSGFLAGFASWLTSRNDDRLEAFKREIVSELTPLKEKVNALLLGGRR